MPTDLNFSQPQYTPPPPAPKSSVWKWVLGGCLTLTVVGMVFLFGVFKVAMNNPDFKKTIDNATEGPRKAGQFDILNTAMRKYQNDHGEAYPRTLDELSPKYLSAEYLKDSEGKMLHYSMPGSDSTDDSVVVSTTPKRGTLLGIPQFTQICLLKDGRVVQDQTTRTDLGGSKDK